MERLLAYGLDGKGNPPASIEDEMRGLLARVQKARCVLAASAGPNAVRPVYEIKPAGPAGFSSDSLPDSSILDTTQISASDFANNASLS